jgi:hypothetical protein
VFPIRAVEDDHVDRPGVEVRQRMKLTGTNSSIGLIVLIACAHRQGERKAFVPTEQRQSLCAQPGECKAFIRTDANDVSLN